MQAALRSPLLDRVMVVFHGSHFLFFLMFGLVVWHTGRAQFRQFARSFTLVMAVGLVCYFLFPTAPPFIAAEQLDALHQIRRIAVETYTRYIPEIYGSFDTNPVAAMPSLHVAFPAVCLLLSYRLFSKLITGLIGLYTAIICFAVLYLGEHYLVDVIAGLLLAVGSVGATKPRTMKIVPESLARAVVVSGVLVGAALWIMALSRAHFGGHH
jgi:membrane-associated phospholipid phosphatase